MGDSNNAIKHAIKEWDGVNAGQTHGVLVRAAKELLECREAQSAGAERVRSVVREAATAMLDERKLYIVRPQKPTMNEIVLEAYGHGRACDAVALQGDDLQVVLADLADRVADQLLGPVARLPPRKEWDAERYDRGDTSESDGYESSDYVDGWNEAIDAVEALAAAGATP